MRNTAFFLSPEQIEQALLKTGRQYFSGTLGRPQLELPWHESKLEIGMSYYPSFTADTPHQHLSSAEHIFIVAGEYKIKLVDTGEEYHLNTGSFFVLEANIKYAGKAMAGTKTFFIKSPGGDDKDCCFDIPAEISQWLSEW